MSSGLAPQQRRRSRSYTGRFDFEAHSCTAVGVERPGLTVSRRPNAAKNFTNQKASLSYCYTFGYDKRVD
jgi:hypothetical protein